jgi:hypothetical protein
VTSVVVWILFDCNRKIYCFISVLCSDLRRCFRSFIPSLICRIHFSSVWFLAQASAFIYSRWIFHARSSFLVFLLVSQVRGRSFCSILQWVESSCLSLFYSIDMIELLLPYRFDTLEYSSVKATIGICTLTDYSMAKKRQQAFWRRCRRS